MTVRWSRIMVQEYTKDTLSDESVFVLQSILHRAIVLLPERNRYMRLLLS